MEVLGHFLNERGHFIVSEFKDGEGVDFVVDRRGEEDSFVAEILLDSVEVVLGSGVNVGCHIFFNFKRF
jgi:hypothetical protein